MNTLSKGVHLPPSNLPPYIFEILERERPRDLKSERKICGFECWYQKSDSILGRSWDADKRMLKADADERNLLVSNVPKVPKSDQKDARVVALEYYAQLVNYFVFTGMDDLLFIVYTLQ